MKTFKSKPIEQSLVALDRLCNAYLASSEPAYKVRVIVVDKVSQYHIVNIRTNVTHSLWMNYDVAMQTMRDLNRMAKKVA